MKKWSPVDPKHFEGETMRQLQDRLKEAQRVVDKFPQFSQGWHNEYMQELRKRIAENIGRRKG